jgi:predicted aspartyl protease
MSEAFLASYFPPIPVLSIYLTPVGEASQIGPLTAIVDTGADATLVPLRYLDDLDVPADYPTRLRGPWGSARRVQVYTTDIVIATLHLPGIEVVGDEMGNEIILGRNVLNHLVLLLDGPGQQSDVFDQRPRIR